MNVRVVIIAIVIGWLPSGCATHVKDFSQGNVGLVSYPSSVENVTLLGELVLPENTTGPVPAMILVHGSGGRDTDREYLWGRLLRNNGIATFAIDYFTPRNITRTSSFQPAPAHDIYDAIKILATHPLIDAQRIGVIGFSRGGHLAVTTSNNGGRFTNGINTTVHVGLYPICEYLNDLKTDPTYPPVLILIGTKDSYSSAKACADLATEKSAAGRDVEAIVYEGAYHAWDSNYNGTWYHQSMNVNAEIRSDERIKRQSMEDVLAFIKQPLGLKE